MKYYTFFSATCLLVSWTSICPATPIQKIETLNAPKALGAYSQTISVDLETTKNLIFVCGQVPLNPISGKMIECMMSSRTFTWKSLNISASVGEEILDLSSNNQR